MATKWKTGDRVKVIKRKVSMDDRLNNTYFEHMAGLTGTVQNVYGKDEVAVVIDPQAFDPFLQEVHKTGVKRMRAKFLDGLSDEQKRKLTPEEKSFHANYVLLVKSSDLEKGPKAPPKAQVQVFDDLEDAEDYDGTSVRDDIIYDDQSVPDTPKRKTSAELASIEERELKKRKTKKR